MTSIFLLSFLVLSLNKTPQKVYLKVENDNLTTSELFIVQRFIQTKLKNQTNIDFKTEATNFTDFHETKKFLIKNKFNGFCYIEASKENHTYSFKIELAKLTSDGELDLKTLELSEQDIPPRKLVDLLIPKLLSFFPPLPPEVLIREKAEVVEIGTFEYVSPTAFLQFGISPGGTLTSVNINTWISSGWYEFEDEKFFFSTILFFEGSLRKHFWGINLYFQYNPLTSSLSFYTGPELNLFKGLITLTAGIGYIKENIPVSMKLQSDSSKFIDGNVEISSPGIRGVIFANITQSYSISIRFSFYAWGKANLSVKNSNVDNELLEKVLLRDIETSAKYPSFSLTSNFRISDRFYLNMGFGLNIFELDKTTDENGEIHIFYPQMIMQFGITYKIDLKGV